MKAAPKQANNDSNRSAIDASQSSWQNQLAQVSNDSQGAVAQRAFIDGINDSPRMLAQRRQIEGYIDTDQQQTAVPALSTSQKNQRQILQRSEKLMDAEKILLEDNFGWEASAKHEQQPVSLSHPVPHIQTKLVIGQPGDIYEQEADRVAAKVVEQINAPASTKSTQEQSVQREAIPKLALQTKPILLHREAIGGGKASTDLESTINGARGSGQPLDVGLQESMGQAMEADFTGVRVHADAQADQLNQSIQARAFTTGQDVFFRQGAYQPRSRRGQALIAHELTHVVQQEKDSGAVKIDSRNLSQISNKSSNKQESNFIQCELDEDFEHGGTPKPGEKELCKSFAQKVSDFVDNSYEELISGKLSKWVGAKIATFFKLVFRNSGVAHTHAANAIEERVYALMPNPMLGLKWTPQFTEGMGGASKPDIVIHVSKEKEEVREALVDITSDKAHLLRKAGGWTTNPRYIYVAEAQFPPILKSDIPFIKENLEKGGINLEDAKRLKEKADAIRAEKKKERDEKVKKIRETFKKFKNFSDFAKNYHEFADLPEGKRVTAAASFLRRNGIKAKGMPEKKGRRKMDEFTKKTKIKRAKKAKEAREKKDVHGKEEESGSENINEEEMLDSDDEEKISV